MVRAKFAAPLIPFLLAAILNVSGYQNPRLAAALWLLTGALVLWVYVPPTVLWIVDRLPRLTEHRRLAIFASCVIVGAAWLIPIGIWLSRDVPASTLYIECLPGLGQPFPPRGSLYLFQVTDRWNGMVMFTGHASPSLPVRPAGDPSRCSITNDGTAALFDVSIPARLTFYKVVEKHAERGGRSYSIGEKTSSLETEIHAPRIDLGHSAAFEFFVTNSTQKAVELRFLEFGTAQSLSGSLERLHIRHARPRMNPLTLFPARDSEVVLPAPAPEQEGDRRPSIPHVFYDCRTGPLPTKIDPEGSIDVVDLSRASLTPKPGEPTGGIGHLFAPDGYLRWPSTPAWGHYCEFTNYSNVPLFNVSMQLHLVFQEAVKNERGVQRQGRVLAERTWTVSVPKVDVGPERPFKFYVVYFGAHFIQVLPPDAVTFVRPGTTESQTIQLRQPGRPTLLLQPLSPAQENVPAAPPKDTRS